jgi:2-iminobutanoate/2-iminopropanoate deaminase
MIRILTGMNDQEFVLSAGTIEAPAKLGITQLNPDTVAAPGGHYSPGTLWNGLIFVSGQLPIKPDGFHLTGADFETQTRQTLANVLAVLAAGGAGPQDVLKVTAYLVGPEHWPQFNSIYAEVFGTSRPARAVVPVPGLNHGYLIEIEAIAVRC